MDDKSEARQRLWDLASRTTSCKVTARTEQLLTDFWVIAAEYEDLEDCNPAT